MHVRSLDPRQCCLLSWSVPDEGWAPGPHLAQLFDGSLTRPGCAAGLLQLARPSDGAALALGVEADSRRGGALRSLRVVAPLALVNDTRLALAFWLEQAQPQEGGDAAVQAQSGAEASAPAPQALQHFSTGPPPAGGASAVYQGERRLAGGGSALASPPAGVAAGRAALRLRVAGSGPSPPLRLGGGDTTALLRCALADGRGATLCCSVEADTGLLARTLTVTLSCAHSLANRCGEALLLRQAGARGVPAALRPGEPALPLVWPDASRPPELQLALAAQPAVWSRPFCVHEAAAAAHAAGAAGAGWGDGPAPPQAAALLLLNQPDPGAPPLGAPPRCLRLSFESGAGGRAAVCVTSAAAPFPVLLVNATTAPLLARQAGALGGSADWASLPPLSSTPVPWEAAWGGGVPAAVDLRPAEAPPHPGASPAPTPPPLRVTLRPGGGAPGAGPWLVLADGSHASVGVASAAGRAVLTVAPLPGPGGAAARPASGAWERELRCAVLEAKVSLVSAAPQELLLLSLDRVSLVAASGLAAGPGGLLDARVCVAQGASLAWVFLLAGGCDCLPHLSFPPPPPLFAVDDQVTGTVYPVCLSHGSADLSQSLLRLLATQADAGGEVGHPLISLVVTPEPIVLRLHEPTLWKLLDMVQRLKAGGTAGAQQAPQVIATGVRADPVVSIGVLLLSPIQAKLTFKARDFQRGFPPPLFRTFVAPNSDPCFCALLPGRAVSPPRRWPGRHRDGAGQPRRRADVAGWRAA